MPAIPKGVSRDLLRRANQGHNGIIAAFHRGGLLRLSRTINPNDTVAFVLAAPAGRRPFIGCCPCRKRER